MEVHSHTHSPRKKFKHYAFEFFMLFVAVFCGFLAESFREYRVERHREHEYIALLQRDFKIDSSSIQDCINFNKRQLGFYDSLLSAVKRKEYEIRSNRLYRYFIETTYYYRFSPTDRAIQQLKNAGGLRLVQNLPASDSITAYYEQAKAVQDQGETFMRYFDEYHRDAFNIFEYGQFDSFLYDPSVAESTVTNMTLMTKESSVLKRFYSKLFVLRFIIVSYLEELERLKLKLGNCRKFLYRAYHS